MLRERVPSRDLETIIETIGDWAERTKDTEILTEYARNALARTLCHQHKGDDGRIHCVTLDPSIEELISKALERTDQGTVLSMPAKLQARIVDAVKAEVDKAATSTRGRPPVLLCPQQIRAWVRRMIEVRLGSVAVMSYNEVTRGFEVESHGMVVLADESENV